MKVKYIGRSFGVESLTNGKIYECTEIVNGMLRIIDDSEEGYLYSAIRPGSLEYPELCGRWEIIEDNENKDLEKLIKWINKKNKANEIVNIDDITDILCNGTKEEIRQTIIENKISYSFAECGEYSMEIDVTYEIVRGHGISNPNCIKYFGRECNWEDIVSDKNKEG